MGVASRLGSEALPPIISTSSVALQGADALYLAIAAIAESSRTLRIAPVVYVHKSGVQVDVRNTPSFQIPMYIFDARASGLT